MQPVRAARTRSRSRACTDGRLDRRRRLACAGRLLLRTRWILRTRRSGAPRSERLDRPGRRSARLGRSGRSGLVQGSARRRGARRQRPQAGAPRQGRQPHPPARSGPDLLRSEVGIPRGARGRRRARHRRPRPGRAPRARLVRAERRRDACEGPGDRAPGPRRRPEDGGGGVQARYFPKPRPPAPHPRRGGEHGAGRRRPMAHHVERKALHLQDADRGDLPRRACAGAVGTRLRDREDPCRRAFRDRGRPEAGDRGVLHPAGGHRGGDGGTRPRPYSGRPAPCRAGGADDPGREARRGQERARDGLAEAGGGSRVRRACVGLEGRVQDGRQGCEAGNRRTGSFRARQGRGRAGGSSGLRPGGRGLGRGAPGRARGGVREDGPASGGDRPATGRGGGRRGRTRGRPDGTRGGTACRQPPRARRVAHHRQGPGGREGDGRADGAGPGRFEARHAELDSYAATPPGTPQYRAARGGEDDPFLARPGRGRPGLCRDRQDHHARPRQGAGREATSAGPSRSSAAAWRKSIPGTSPARPPRGG